jgi:hypothetical protein
VLWVCKLEGRALSSWWGGPCCEALRSISLPRERLGSWRQFTDGGRSAPGGNATIIQSPARRFSAANSFPI